eukprot:COSAG06_NODE_4290_length_4394_cov_4.272643_1_plen_432_part_00
MSATAQRRLTRLNAHVATTSATAVDEWADQEGYRNFLEQLAQRHAVPGTPPRERRVPIQHHMQDDAAASGSPPPPPASIPGLSALWAEAQHAAELTPAWAPMRTAAEMGGDYPYGSRPASGFSLTDAQVAHFCHEGYCVLPNVYSAEEVSTLRSHASAALSRLTSQAAGSTHGVNFSFAPGPEQGASAPHHAADQLNPHRVAQVDDFHKMDSAIEGHMRCPRMTNALTELLGADIDAYQVTTITKPPKFEWAGGGYNFHQDVCDYGGGGDTNGQSTNFRYGGLANFGNLCCITYLCDSGPGRGSTTVVPRTHRAADGSEGPVRRPLWTTHSTGGVWSGPFRTVEGWEELEARAVTPHFHPGDVLMFDSWVVHRANGNADEESKIGLLNVYCRPDCVPRDQQLWNYPGLHLPVVRGGKQVPSYWPAAAVSES